MLNEKELKEIEQAYREDELRYRRLADFVLGKCNAFRERNPKVARIILAREPLIKTLASITRKIEDRRSDKSNPDPKYSFEHLTDIVAVSILCPFESDIQEVAKFLRGAFDVAEASNKDAERNHESGHRGYHFTISLLAGDLLEAFSDLEGLKSEIQVKTILAEAFDAKSHDLAYKPGRFEVGDELKKQFSLLASGLRAMDGQSEFLKGLIAREQTEMDLRRTALLGRYLSQQETTEAGRQIGIDLGASPKPEVVQIVTALRKIKLQKGPILPPVCKFAALCALEFGNDALKILALKLADKLVEADPDSLRFQVVRGYVYWVLGEYTKALEANRSVMNSGRTDEGSLEWVKQSRNNFVYFICDWNLFKKEKDEKLLEDARCCIREILSAGKPQRNEADTIGLFKILFGDFEEIEEGRRLLKISRKSRKNHQDTQTYEQFYRLHDYIALSRLAKLAKEIFDQPV